MMPNTNPDSTATSTPTEAFPKHPSSSEPRDTEPNVVHDRPGVLDRFLVNDTSVDGSLELEMVSDDELPGLLSEAGQPAFLGRIDGQMVLIPRKSL